MTAAQASIESSVSKTQAFHMLQRQADEHPLPFLRGEGRVRGCSLASAVGLPFVVSSQRLISEMTAIALRGVGLTPYSRIAASCKLTWSVI
jgi:hypothetical protein